MHSSLLCMPVKIRPLRVFNPSIYLHDTATYANFVAFYELSDKYIY